MQDRSSKAAIAERSAKVRLFQNAKGIQAPELVVCNPHGRDDESIHDRVFDLEANLKEVATADNFYSFVVGMLDKASQNCINQLGGFTGAGDAAIAAYWDVARRAVGGLAFVNGSQTVEIIRVTAGSDEGVFIMGSRHLSHYAEAQFRAAWAHARGTVRLSDYAYSIEVPSNGGTRTYDLDLKAFSRILRHPDMTVSCHASVSQPRRIDPATGGFITEVIREMENREIGFYRQLPWSFRAGNGGLAEVNSPFRTNLARLGARTRDSGTFVEIKLSAPEARELLAFVHDNGGQKGTRKGFAEIYSGNFGMRGFNTFLGKARANRILTPITWAMDDLGKRTAGADGKHPMVLPLNDGYLQYWIDLPPTEATRRLVKDAVDRRIHTTRADPAYVNISLRPVITLLDASQVSVRDARARFILDSLDRSSYPACILERTDFLLNFLENVNHNVQKDIFEKLTLKAYGGSSINSHDVACIGRIRQICARTRTIRNTEDLVWTIRADDSLPTQIKHVRTVLENWLFDFAAERFEALYRLLAEKIREQMGRKP